MNGQRRRDRTPEDSRTVECSPGLTLTLCEFISSERGGGEPCPFFFFFLDFLANGVLKNQNGKKRVFSITSGCP